MSQSIVKKLLNPKVSRNDGIVVIDDCKVSAEQIKKVRKINFIEPFVVYGAALATIWGTMLDESNPVMYIMLGILCIWMLLISPWWHYEKLNEKEIFLREDQRNLGYWYLECRGLGSPKRYWKKDENGVRGFVKHKKEIKEMMIFWDLALFCIPYAFPEDYKEIIIQIFGTSNAYLQTLGVIIMLIGADLAMFLILFPIMLRLDNFQYGWDNQLKVTFLIGVPFVIFFNLFFILLYPQLLNTFGTEGAFGMKGADPFTRMDKFNLLDLGGQMAGYIGWGVIQQLLFLSIFSTNFSRAFDLLNDKRGVKKAAFLSAFFFGLIHLPNFWLSIMTWVAGFAWSLMFMECRNLALMGLSHGTLGSLGNKLLPISYNVGPSSI